MSRPKRTAPADYGVPALRLDEQPFKVRELAKDLSRSGLTVTSPIALCELARRLNLAAIAHWARSDLAAAPTARMRTDAISGLERAARKLLEQLSPREPGDWLDPDDYSPGVSPELVRLLAEPLDRAMRERVEQARHHPDGDDATITELELFGTSDPADVLRICLECTALLARATMDVRHSGQYGEPEDIGRPEHALIRTLGPIFQETFGKPLTRTFDPITGEPSGPWFRFVVQCCRTIGIDAAPKTIDGWLRGR